MKAIYPGSFNPLTLGHLDIIERASKIFDEVLVLVSNNPSKKEKLKVNERVKLIKEATAKLPNIKTTHYDGLTADYARKHGYQVLLRGMRAASDFEMELEMSQVNHSIADGIETVFLMTSPEHSFIRSSRVWELLEFGAEIHNLVPKNVEKYLQKLRRGLK